MAEQFDVKLVEGAKHHAPRPGHRERIWIGDHEGDSRGVLPKEW